MHSDSLFHVDLSAIAQNASMFARLVGPDAVCCGVVKADAYGLGARPVAETLMWAGMPLVAVFRVDEALDLLSLAACRRVLVLGAVRSLCPMHPLVPGLADGRIELVVHDEHQLREIAALAAGQSIAIQVHVKVDTGMGRGGCGPCARRPWPLGPGPTKQLQCHQSPQKQICTPSVFLISLYWNSLILVHSGPKLKKTSEKT